MQMKSVLAAAFAAIVAWPVAVVGQPAAGVEAELLFPLEHWHNHSSSIVEHPDGGFFVTWFHGSGERTADDVELLGAWKMPGASSWSAPMRLADTPAYPDTNPTLMVDRRDRLWLLWPTILANEWHTALMKYKVASRWTPGTMPAWDTSEVLHLSPGDRFAEVTARETRRLESELGAETSMRERALTYLARLRTMPRTSSRGVLAG